MHKEKSSKPNFVNSIAIQEMAESLLLGTLGKDYGDGVFKYLDPRGLARLEATFTRELVFVPPYLALAIIPAGGRALGC